MHDAMQDYHLLKTSSGNYQEELDNLKVEYFNYKQDNMQADIQIKDLSNEWRRVSELLDKSNKEIDRLQSELMRSTLQNSKMKERQTTLEQEHREVAQHVHDYYSTINELERKLEKEIQNSIEITYEKSEVQQELHRFKAMEYEPKLKELKETQKFSHALQIKFANLQVSHAEAFDKVKLELKSLNEKLQAEQSLKRESQLAVTKLQTELSQMKIAMAKTASQNESIKYES